MGLNTRETDITIIEEDTVLLILDLDETLIHAAAQKLDDNAHFLYEMHISKPRQMSFRRSGGRPRLHSDNGTEFISSVTQQLFQLMQTRFHAGCSYHPQSQGTVERIHRTIAEYLRIFVDESTTNWEEFLGPLCFALNTKIHSRTKMTAYWMTFAEHPLLPWVSPTNRQSYSESEIRFSCIKF